MEERALLFVRRRNDLLWLVVVAVTWIVFRGMDASPMGGNQFIRIVRICDWLGLGLVVLCRTVAGPSQREFEKARELVREVDAWEQRWLDHRLWTGQRGPQHWLVTAPVNRLPVLEAYLLATLVNLSLYGARGVLRATSVGHLGPADAPAVVGAVVGIPGMVAAAIAMAPRLVRAWGAKTKDEGEGSGAVSSGRAEIIRAEKEGEAAVIRAQAELKRAEAELKRAELGLDPLPPQPAAPEPPSPPALPAPSSNGGPVTSDSQP